MTLHIQTPTQKHLSRAYYELGNMGARAVGQKCAWPYKPKTNEALLALCAEMARHDPRLFELVLQTMSVGWQKINWFKLRQEILNIKSPQVFGIIGDILSATTRDPELANCFRFLMYGIDAAPTQFFYNNLYVPGSPMANRALNNRLKEFEDWGFLASERPALNADSKATAGSLSRHARLECLKRLLAQRQQIRLQDYLQALAHPISRQQALLDLKSVKGIRRQGHGRGAVWYLSSLAARRI